MYIIGTQKNILTLKRWILRIQKRGTVSEFKWVSKILTDGQTLLNKAKMETLHPVIVM